MPLISLQELSYKLNNSALPNRDLDFAIESYLHHPFKIELSEHKTFLIVYDQGPGNPPRAVTPLAYTSSWNAAFTLIPKDHDWIIANVNGHMGGTPYTRVGYILPEVYGETPLVSLIIACLRARAKQGEGK